MKLHYKQYGEGDKSIIILHGLMGMLDNWVTLGKKFAETYSVFIVDQRNHGHSPHSLDLFTYEAMSEDLAEFIDDMFLYKVHLIGHSMGGKTIMKFAQTYPKLIDKMVIVDICNKKYPVHHQHIIKALKNVPLQIIQRRMEAVPYLRKYIKEKSIIQFLIKNLYHKNKDIWEWRFNLEIIERDIEYIGVENNKNKYYNKVLFLKGEWSDYIKNNDVDYIKEYFPNSIIKTIPNSGHWIHADNPIDFYDTTMNFFAS